LFDFCRQFAVAFCQQALATKPKLNADIVDANL